MSEDGKRTTILLVDDEVDMRMLVRVIIDLANHGLTVVGEAADGEEAIDAWRSLNGDAPPDIIVLDNRMPQMSGLEVARQILEEHPGQKIVLFSAFLDHQVRAEAEAVGIVGCVTKEEADRLPDLIRTITAA